MKVLFLKWSIFISIVFLVLYFINNNFSFIYLSKGSETDVIQAYSSVMSFIGGAASVIVAILVSRKDNNNRRKDLYSKRAIIIYYMYYALCDLEDAMNMFVRDFEPFVKERKT